VIINKVNLTLCIKNYEQAKTKIIDNNGDKKYFAMIPYYIINDSSIYEQSLYLIMKRIASKKGACWASAITISRIMKASPNTVRKYRNKLLKRGWIRIVGNKGKTKPTNEFEIVDLWKLNVDYHIKGGEMRWYQNKWWVIPRGGGQWLEFAGEEKNIKWSNKHYEKRGNP